METPQIRDYFLPFPSNAVVARVAPEKVVWGEGGAFCCSCQPLSDAGLAAPALGAAIEVGLLASGEGGNISEGFVM